MLIHRRNPRSGWEGEGQDGYKMAEVDEGVHNPFEEQGTHSLSPFHFDGSRSDRRCGGIERGSFGEETMRGEHISPNYFLAAPTIGPAREYRQKKLVERV
jgi:hypothetical protein